MPKTPTRRAKLTEAESAQTAANQLRLAFVDDQATNQADRSNELLRYQDPGEQPHQEASMIIIDHPLPEVPDFMESDDCCDFHSNERERRDNSDSQEDSA